MVPRGPKGFPEYKRGIHDSPDPPTLRLNPLAILEADTSNEALGGMVSQYDDDGILDPCPFHSCKFTSVERNYEIYNKEMLAIVECMDVWRHYLQGADHKLKVLADYRNLIWFTETKSYNHRQARWAEELSRFDFVMQFRPGVEAGKPDTLSRRPDYWPPKGGGVTLRHATNSRSSSLNK